MKVVQYPSTEAKRQTHKEAAGHMTQIEILQELKKLTSVERLAVAEAVLRLLREDLQLTGQSRAEVKRELAKAAQALLPDYQAGGDLTAFTVLDNEDFCGKG